MVEKHEHDMVRLELVFLRLMMNLTSNYIRVVGLRCRRRLHSLQNHPAGSGGLGF